MSLKHNFEEVVLYFWVTQSIVYRPLSRGDYLRWSFPGGRKSYRNIKGWSESHSIVRPGNYLRRKQYVGHCKQWRHGGQTMYSLLRVSHPLHSPLTRPLKHTFERRLGRDWGGLVEKTTIIVFVATLHLRMIWSSFNLGSNSNKNRI